MFVKPNPFYKRPKTRGWERIFKLMYKQLGINRTAYVPVVDDNGDPKQVQAIPNATGIPVVDAFNAVSERRGDNTTIEAEQYPIPNMTDIGDIMEVESTVKNDNGVTNDDLYEGGQTEAMIEATRQSNEDAEYFAELFEKQRREREKIQKQPKKKINLQNVLEEWKEKTKEKEPEIIDLTEDDETPKPTEEPKPFETPEPTRDPNAPTFAPGSLTPVNNNPNPEDILSIPTPPNPEELEYPKPAVDDFDKYFDAKFGITKEDDNINTPVKEIKKIVKNGKVTKKLPKKTKEKMEATAKILQNILLKEYEDIITVKMAEEEPMERKEMEKEDHAVDEMSEEENSQESIQLPEVTLEDVEKKRPTGKRGYEDVDDTGRSGNKTTNLSKHNQVLVYRLDKSKIEERKRELATFETEIKKLARTTNQYKIDLQDVNIYKEELRQLQEEIFKLYNEYEDIMGYTFDDQLETMEKDEVGGKKVHLDKNLDEAMDELLEDKSYIEYFDLYEKLNQLIDKRDNLVEKLYTEYGEVRFWKELGVTKDQLMAVLLGHEDDNVYHVLEVVLPVIGHYSSIIQDLNRDLKFMITYGPPTFDITLPENEKEFIVGEYWPVYAWGLQHDRDMATWAFKRERNKLYKAVFGETPEKDKTVGMQGKNIEEMEIPENILYKYNYVQYFPNSGRLRYISVGTKSNQSLRIKNAYLDGIDESNFILKASKITNETIKAELLVDESKDRLARTTSVNRYKNLILNGLILLYSTKNQESQFWKKMNNYVHAIIKGSTIYRITPGKMRDIISDTIKINNVSELLTKENIQQVITKNISHDPSQQTIPSGKFQT